ncbi:hypothetical protein FB446DRAFT_109979 [Lentinula raphanica]|nr:hypothetical protein FB446DRAFT_109979 [Lentinula raphanica]
MNSSDPPRQPLEPLFISIGRLDNRRSMVSLRSPRTPSVNDFDVLRIGHEYFDLPSAYDWRAPYKPPFEAPIEYNYYQSLAKAHFDSEETRDKVYQDIRDAGWVRDECERLGYKLSHKNIDYVVCIANWLKNSHYVKPGDSSKMGQRLDKYTNERDTALATSFPLHLPLMLARVMPDGSWAPNILAPPPGVTFVAVLLIGNEEIFISPANNIPNLQSFPLHRNPNLYMDDIRIRDPGYYRPLAFAKFPTVAIKDYAFLVLRDSRRLIEYTGNHRTQFEDPNGLDYLHCAVMQYLRKHYVLGDDNLQTLDRNWNNVERFMGVSHAGGQNQ